MKKRALTVFALLVCLLFCACGGAKKENTVFSVDDLPGKTIAVRAKTTADTYASGYERDGSNTTILRYEEWDQALTSLLQGKSDCVILDQKMADSFVREHDDIRILDDIFQDEEYGILIAKENKELLDHFNEALREIKKEELLDDITRYYFAEDRPKTPYYETPPGTEHPNGKLVMATIANFEPYEYYAGNQLLGIDIDLAYALCDKLGYELVIAEMEFSKIFDAVAKHRTDFGMAGVTVTRDRMRLVSFTEPYATERQVILVRK